MKSLLFTKNKIYNNLKFGTFQNFLKIVWTQEQKLSLDLSKYKLSLVEIICFGEYKYLPITKKCDFSFSSVHHLYARSAL